MTHFQNDDSSSKTATCVFLKESNTDYYSPFTGALQHANCMHIVIHIINNTYTVWLMHETSVLSTQKNTGVSLHMIIII